MPRSRTARFTSYLAAVEIVLLVLKGIFNLAGWKAAASFLAAFTGPLGFLLTILVIWLAIRWFRGHVMWSVRNRLIVTYLFIGGVPVALALAMSLVGGYLVLEHLATFMAFSEIHAQEQRLSAANQALAHQLKANPAAAPQLIPEDRVFTGQKVSVVPVAEAPAWIKGSFSGLVTDQGQIYLRAADPLVTKQGKAYVISSVLVDRQFLSRVASGIGQLTLYLADLGNDTNAAADRTPSITAGIVSEPKAALDREFNFGGLIQTTDWATASSETQHSRFLAGVTRLSSIYSYLTASMGIWTGVVGVMLVAIAAAFAIVVLIALLIGIRLTRTVTFSVANLYRATQHINRGDFGYRIQVKEKDQLAALQMSFNSMTQSLQRLIAEQKEKERLQSELEIAHEVQAQLFPQAVSGTRTLELHGICRPARIVSGDYYDFLEYGPDQIGIAVGDISGKGISAALLMASIHSAVRAYEQEQIVSVSSASAYSGNPSAVATRVAPPSPAHMLWLLNRHLYRTTQPEKYATLFLGFYDGDTHRLTYSNAGHLAPILLGRDGSVRRLEAGGMVVGLFDAMQYQEETVELFPGDIFVAFSDGMTEPENEFGEFGEDRLIESIAENRDLPLARISAQAVQAVKDWFGSTEQPDDITLVLARRVS
ncbi:MAG TPA: SpoIIE family protein phosphatase [Terriglobales bacterium]|nr:SpoIIE family protein phosphatase [Terriglobales bacterium]